MSVQLMLALLLFKIKKL